VNIINKKDNNSFKSNLIKYRSLSEITTGLIRRDIIRGKLLPGLHVTEKNLSDKFGVSRLVIREATISLISEGLLLKEKNKYTQVVDFSKKDISDIFELRIALEVSAIKKYIELGSNKLDILKSKSVMLDKLSSRYKLNNIETLVRKDIEFHKMIVEETKNKILINVWEKLSFKVLLLLYKYVINRKSKDIELSFDHNKIVNAILDGEEKFAQDVITEHIGVVNSYLLDNF